MQQPISRHAQVRVRQRGFREGDIVTVMENGTRCAEAIVLTDHDAQRAIRVKKREIQDLERLRGTAVVVSGGTVSTIYRPDRKRLRRFLSRRPGSKVEQ